MNRRTYLTAVCSSSVLTAGCLSGDSQLALTEQTVTVTERGCSERSHSISPSYDRSSDRFRLKGVFANAEQCGPLGMDAFYGAEDGRAYVDILVLGSGDCPSCQRYYEYEAVGTFRRTPDSITVLYTGTTESFGQYIPVTEEAEHGTPI